MFAAARFRDPLLRLPSRYGRFLSGVGNGSLSERYTKTFPQATSCMLPILCERGSFSYAEAWVQQGKDITCISTVSNTSRSPSPDAVADVATLKRQSTMKFAVGEGLVGATWKAATPTWRDSASGLASIKQCLSVPAVIDGRVEAVLNFYSDKPMNKAVMADFARLAGPMIHTQVTAGAVRPVLNRTGTNVSQVQMDAVYDACLRSGIFTAAAVYEDLSHFYNDLGLSQEYFDRYGVDDIAHHVMAYMSAKKLSASADPTTQQQITARMKTHSGFCYMVPADRKSVTGVESECDKLRADTRADSGLMVARYISDGSAVPYGDKKLAVYVVDVEPYAQADMKVTMLEEDIYKIAPVGLLKKPDALIQKYQALIKEKQGMLAPLVRIQDPLPDGTIPMMIGMRSTAEGKVATQGMNNLIAEMVGSKLWAKRKYFTTFSNGLIFYSLYLEPAPKEDIENLANSIRLLCMLPRESCEATLPLLVDHVLDAAEYSYSVCASNFAYYFLQTESPDLAALEASFKHSDPETVARLKRVMYQLQQRAVPTQRINMCVNQHADLIKELYLDFKKTFNPKYNSDLSKKPAVNDALKIRIQKEVVDEVDRLILEMFLTFNASVVKTNFYNNRKSTLAFRLEPAVFFGGMSQYTETPYGISMIMSNDFRGFHVRFMPVARGGLRLIRSSNPEARFKNAQSLFKENYGLARTQNKKNKDIPEFGSKGTILLEPANQSFNAGEFAFMKYVSGMMDLLLPTPEMNDFHKKEEIVFCGPDEGTADFMAPAAYYAKSRNYKYWSAFTTGKPPKMGGIPHDQYGMTTRSIRQFINGIIKDEGLKEENIRKLQTGGPDGDLGSNEIKMSKDITIGIADGSGVVFDPNGLNREEIGRLATRRFTVDRFDKSKLSKEGALVLTTDKNVKLPDGTMVESGVIFRDEFHFHPMGKADMFVPCGGRPEAINARNVHRLINPKTGETQFKYIVEGANLFITEEACDVLERAGVVVYKDASTNKGGVTSSSFEVLASLAMDDATHAKHMRADDKGNLPEFYKKYVQEIISIIEENARLEYSSLHEYCKTTKTPRFRATEILSNKINDLNTQAQNSKEWENKVLRREVLRRALPKTLQELMGLDNIISRLPEDYLKAVFGCYVASRYVYGRGMTAEGSAEFSSFMASLTKNRK